MKKLWNKIIYAFHALSSFKFLNLTYPYDNYYSKNLKVIIAWSINRI